MAIKASPYAAMLDACVLYPAPLRDLLIQIAVTGLYRTKWTNEIHEEWIGAVLKDRADLTRAQLERTRDLMNGAVMDCLVGGYQALIPAVFLPDPKDRHVLAAAIHARCGSMLCGFKSATGKSRRLKVTMARNIRNNRNIRRIGDSAIWAENVLSFSVGWRPRARDLSRR